MDSETTVEDESDLMSVISETTVGSINSPIMLNLLSRFKQPVSTDSIHRNSAASPSIPDQNFNLSTIESDFYKEAVGNLANEVDADKSQSLLSERCGSNDLRSIEDKGIASLKLGSLEYSHASLRVNEEATSWDDNHVLSPKVEDIYDVEANNQLVDNEGNKAVGDTLADILTSLECASVLHDNPLSPVQDVGAAISRVKTGEIQLSPFTGFDSEIYPESVPVTIVPCETQCSKNSPIHRPTEKNCPDLLNIGNIHKTVEDDNTQSATKDDGDQVKLFERDFTTTTANEKYVNIKRNTLISSSVLHDVRLDDDTQAPISGDQSLELNLSANLETTNSICPIESYVGQKDEQSICSEDCHQNAPKREDIHGVQDIQASSPQFSVVSDQSTEICRLDLRTDTSDIAYSQSNCIPMDFMTSGVTCGGDPDTTNRSSNNCSIETTGSNAKSSLQDDDKETKLQDPIDISPNLDSIFVSNLQPDNFEECRGSCNDQFEQDLSPHKIIMVNEDNSKFQSIERTDRIEITSSPAMSCVSESILCTKIGKESHKSEAIQKQDFGFPIQPIVDKPDMAEEDTARTIINEENMLIESERESSPFDYNQANEVKQTVVVLGSCIAVTPLTKGQSESDDNRQSNNHTCKDLIIDERAMCIDGEYDNLSLEAKEGNEDPKSANGNSWAIRDISDSKIQASPTELKDRKFSQPLNNPKSTYSPEKYKDMAGLDRKLEIMPAPKQELLQNKDTQHQTMLTDTLINASSELSNPVPKHSDSSKTDYTPEHLNKSNQSSRMSQNVSTCLPNSDTPKQLEPIRRLKPVDPGNFMDKLEHQEISKNNTQDQLSQSTCSYKSMIYSQNFQKSKTVVHENECSQQETPETAMRRSSRESKQPIRFSSPEQNIKSKADRPESPNRKTMPISKLNFKTGSKKQKIPITFTNTKIEGRGKTQDLDFGDDFEVHQEKLNSYIQMEIKYGQLQDDMKRNQPDRESLKRCSFQFKTLQPQLMKLLSDSKQESQKISSKKSKESDKSMMKTRIKLLSIRQKKLKALFDKHCRVQSILRLMKSKLGAEDTMNFTQASFSQSTTSSKNSKLYIPVPQTTHQSTILTKACQIKVLNSETGLFESGGQKIPITQRARPEAMAQMVSNVEIQSKSASAVMSNFVETSSNRDGPPRQANAITFVSVPSSTDSTLKPAGNPPKTPGNQSQKIFFIPVGKASVGQNQNTTTNASLNPNEQSEERRRSKILITQKFVPPTKPIFVRVDNTGSKGASATSDLESTNSIPRNNINNKPSIPSGIITPAPQRTHHQGTNPHSNDDEILDIILKSLDKDSNESKVPVNSSYPVQQSLSPPYQDDSDSNGFEFDDEVVDLTKEGEIVSNINEPQTKMTRLDRITLFSGTVPNQQSTVQENSANVKIVQNQSVKPSASEMNDLEEHGRPTNKSSETKANNQVPTKTPVKKSPFHSPCRSVMSFTSGFSTSSTRYLMKMKQKALKINQAKTVRDFQTAMGNSPNSKKFKKFPSLKRMIDKGLLTPGKNNLSIIRKGERVAASLLNSGLILDANGQGFSTAIKWFSALTGTHLTMKAKAYRMICYENTPLMEFKKQYDKLEFNNASSQTQWATDSREQSNKANSVLVVTSSSKTRNNTATVFPTTCTRSVMGPSTITATPRFKTAFQTSTATMPVRYPMTLPRPINPQYPHQSPNPVHYSIRTPVSVPRNLIRATNIGSPLSRSLIGNQRVLDQRNWLIQTGSLSVDQSKTGDDASLIRPIDPQSLLNEEIRSMLMKSVNVLLVSDSELMYYPDITEDFWLKPFKDVDISTELWKEVDAW